MANTFSGAQTHHQITVSSFSFYTPLFFIFIVPALLSFFLVQSCQAATPSTTQTKQPLSKQVASAPKTSPLQTAFEKASAQEKNLKNNPVKSSWRQPWEELRNVFFDIYRKSTDKTLSAQALYQATLCQTSLATASRSSKEYQAAAELDEKFATEFPTHANAAPRLLAAAIIYIDTFTDIEKAQKLLTLLSTRYKKTPQSVQAQALTKRLAQEKKASLQSCELVSIKWNIISQQQIDLIFNFTAPIQPSYKINSNKQSKKATITVSIQKAKINALLRNGCFLQTSIVKKIAVHNSQILIECNQFVQVTARMAKNNKQYILSCMAPATKQQLNKKTQDKTALTPKKCTFSLPSLPAPHTFSVIIDPGHGGKDPGAEHHSIVERDVTLDVAKRLRQRLRQNGITVILTRQSNCSVSLDERRLSMLTQDADLFISLHVNAHETPDIRGFEVYYGQMTETTASTANPTSMRPNVSFPSTSRASQQLARDVQSQTMLHLKYANKPMTSGGVKPASLFVLTNTPIPAILAELGYCTNTLDAQLLASGTGRQLLAEGIAEGILAYRNRLVKKTMASLPPRHDG